MSLTDRLYVARIAERQAAHPTCDFRLRPRIPRAGEPIGESPNLENFDHV
jgi:hypothetical protein